MGSSYPGFVPLGAHYVSISSFRFFVSAAVFNNIVTVCAGSSWWLWRGRQGGGGLRQGAVGQRGEGAVDDNGAAEQGGGMARTSRFGCSNKTTLCLPTWRNLRYYCGLIDRSCFQGMVNLQMNMFQ